jgi:hypothetical protein
MKRAANWPTLLTAFIEERRDVPFAWGRADCCLFAADWVRLATDLDPAADLRGKYDSAASGMRLLRKLGGVCGILLDARKSCGIVEVETARCSRGDLIVADTGRGNAIGIYLGHCSAFVGRDGLIFAPVAMLNGARCWRI